MYLGFDMFTEDDIIVSSFNWEELEAFRKKNKNVHIGVLTDENQDPMEALPFAKKLRAKNVHPEASTLTEAIVKNIKKRGLKIFTWFEKEPKMF